MSLTNRNQNISVSTDRIRQQAQQAKDFCEKILDHMKSIENKVEASAFFWNTDSSQLLYKYFEEDKLDYDEIKNKLYLQIEHLNKIAALYESSEQVSQEAVSELPNAIIK